jgi:hypothetical protein
MTTIKIDAGLRDRINGAAREQGVTAGSFVEQLFDRWVREQHYVAMREAMTRTPPGLLESYQRETGEWEAATAADGLADEPPYPRPPGDARPDDDDAR